MCLAIPMRVLEVREGLPPVAVVDSGGIQREVRLDVLDRTPQNGSYLIVHAGFAIETLDEAEAEESLRLWREILDAGSDNGERESP